MQRPELRKITTISLWQWPGSLTGYRNPVVRKDSLISRNLIPTLLVYGMKDLKVLQEGGSSSSNQNNRFKAECWYNGGLVLFISILWWVRRAGYHRVRAIPSSCDCFFLQLDWIKAGWFSILRLSFASLHNIMVGIGRRSDLRRYFCWRILCSFIGFVDGGLMFMLYGRWE